MAVYRTQADKDAALQDFHEQLAAMAVRTEDPRLRSWVKGLRTILDTPVADTPRPEDDNTADMSVTVAWPLRKGEMQTAVFDRNGGPDHDTTTRHDRVIMRALLEHALECLG